MTIPLMHVTTKYAYNLANLPALHIHDKPRAWFLPVNATVARRDHDWHNLRVYGYRKSNGTAVSFDYRIVGGQLVPDPVHGQAPKWMWDILALAVAEHARQTDAGKRAVPQ